MNANAKRWVEALRSGNFPQGTNVLKRADGKYCCLGVACELYQRAHPSNPMKLEPISEFSTTDERIKCVCFNGESLSLPAVVMDWLGMKQKEGAYGEGFGTQHLSNDNDGGKTFLQIADIIEKHADELFVKDAS